LPLADSDKEGCFSVWQLARCVGAPPLGAVMVGVVIAAITITLGG
jgi:hypothetical protein